MEQGGRQKATVCYFAIAQCAPDFYIRHLHQAESNKILEQVEVPNCISLHTIGFIVARKELIVIHPKPSVVDWQSKKIVESCSCMQRQNFRFEPPLPDGIIVLIVPFLFSVAKYTIMPKYGQRCHFNIKLDTWHESGRNLLAETVTIDAFVKFESPLCSIYTILSSIRWSS